MGDPESREHSPVKFCGTTLPSPACSLKSSITHKEYPAHGGPDSRDRSTAKSLKGVDSSIAHRGTHIVAHKDNPAVEALIQGITQQHTQVVQQILQILLKVTLLHKKVTTLPRPLQEHHLYLPPKVNLKGLKPN